MKKSNKRLVEVLIVVLISTFIGMLAGTASIYTLISMEDKKDLDVSKLEEIDSVFDKIVEDYYDNVDKEKLIEGAVSGMLSVLDENTSYMDKANSTSFNNKMKGEYFGIGVEALTLEGTGVLVVGVTPGSPAERSGIKVDDTIIEVDGTSLIDKEPTFFTNLVSETKEEMKLVITRNDRKLNISVKPEKVVIPSVSTNKFVVDNKRIGYIKISIFAANTDTQFATKLKELEENGIDSLVIDVRDNSGGYLSTASTILEMFMKKGTILYNIETKNSTSERKDTTDEHREYPVAVLTNGSSASASEVLAACFKDNLNSDIVGNTTYGKGTVQEVINVLEGATAKITTKKWLTPKGEWINEVGLTPTIRVSLSDEYYQNPIYDNDNQLESAINAIKMKK